MSSNILLADLKLVVLARADWESAAHLSAEISTQTLNPAFFNWSFESALSEFEKSETLIFKKDALILAYLSFRSFPDRLEIMALATSRAAARKGLGSKLIHGLQLIAAQRSLPVCLEVHENNQQAVNFYLKNRFSVIGRRKSYYSDGGAAVVMQSQTGDDIQS